MEEQLTAHEEERKVVHEVTGKEETTHRVVLDQLGWILGQRQLNTRGRTQLTVLKVPVPSLRT